MIMRLTRIIVGLVGLAVLGFGAWLVWPLLLAVPRAGLSFPAWLIAGPFVHDGLIAPIVGLSGLLVLRRLPPAWRTPVATGSVVSGVLLLLSIPHLWRAYAPNHFPGLNDRNYGAGVLIALAVVWAVVAVVIAARLLRARRAHHSRQRRKKTRTSTRSPSTKPTNNRA
ncbi:MAG TPA: hypothetical protein VF444_02315 [Pseudonocardiaceae bacterium]